MAETNNNTPLTNSEEYKGTGWKNFNQLVLEINKLVEYEMFDSSQIFLSIMGSIDSSPEIIYGKTSAGKGSIKVKLVNSNSPMNAATASTSYSLLLIRSSGEILSLIGPQQAAPLLQEEITNEVEIIKQTSISELSQVKANLGLESSFGISAQANAIVSQRKLDARIDTQQSTAYNENPYNKSGISTNRPTVLINSTYVNPDLENQNIAANQRLKSSILYSLTTYENIKKTINDIKVNNLESYIELEEEYNEFLLKIENSINMVKELDEFKNNIVESFDDYSIYGLDRLGFQDNITNTTQTVLQLFYDLGKVPLSGVDGYLAHLSNPSYFRSLENPEKRGEATYQVTEESVLEGNNDPIVVFKPPEDWQEKVKEAYRYRKNAWPSFAHWSDFESYITHYQGNDMFSNYSIALSDGDSQDITMAVVNSIIWSELYNSYVYANSSESDKAQMDIDLDNNCTLASLIGTELIGQGLVNTSNSSGLAGILRHSQGGKTIMPFEKPGMKYESDDEGIANIQTGIEAWINPNIGKTFEEESPDYSGLDSWIEKFGGIIERAKSKINPQVVDGGGLLVLNEFVRGLETVILTRPITHPNINSIPSDHDDFKKHVSEDRWDESFSFWDNKLYGTQTSSTNGDSDD